MWWQNKADITMAGRDNFLDRRLCLSVRVLMFYISQSAGFNLSPVIFLLQINYRHIVDN